MTRFCLGLCGLNVVFCLLAWHWELLKAEADVNVYGLIFDRDVSGF